MQCYAALCGFVFNSVGGVFCFVWVAHCTVLEKSLVHGLNLLLGEEPWQLRRVHERCDVYGFLSQNFINKDCVYSTNYRIVMKILLLFWKWVFRLKFKKLTLKLLSRCFWDINLIHYHIYLYLSSIFRRGLVFLFCGH